MRTRGRLSIMAAALVVIGSSLLSAPSASASTGNVWFQSIGRASATAACPDPSFGTPWQDNWDVREQAWRPSYSQWMNGGRGGWTCDRQITWARTPYPSGGCVHANGLLVNFWVNFNGGWYVTPGATYDTSGCTTTDGGFLFGVYAPSGWDGAALCREAFPNDELSPSAIGTEGVWGCGVLG